MGNVIINSYLSYSTIYNDLQEKESITYYKEKAGLVSCFIYYRLTLYCYGIYIDV